MLVVQKHAEKSNSEEDPFKSCVSNSLSSDSFFSNSLHQESLLEHNSIESALKNEKVVWTLQRAQNESKLIKRFEFAKGELNGPTDG